MTCVHGNTEVLKIHRKRSTLTQKHSLPWLAVYRCCTRRVPAESMLHVRVKGTLHFLPLALML